MRLRIAILVPSAPPRSHLLAILHRKADLFVCEDAPELFWQLASGTIDVIVMEPIDAEHWPIARLLRRIRQLAPAAPVVAYCSWVPEHIRGVVAMAKVGVTDVILRGKDDDGPRVWRRLQEVSKRESVVAAIRSALRDMLPREFEPVIAACVDAGGTALKVDVLAAALDVTSRTLCNRLRAAGLPSPGSLISWCRLMFAARMLEDPLRSVESVAHALRFGSGAGLSNMIRQYTGMRPSELRELGGLECVLQALEKSRVGSSQQLLTAAFPEMPAARVGLLGATAVRSRD